MDQDFSNREPARSTHEFHGPILGHEISAQPATIYGPTRLARTSGYHYFEDIKVEYVECSKCNMTCQERHQNVGEGACKL